MSDTVAHPTMPRRSPQGGSQQGESQQRFVPPPPPRLSGRNSYSIFVTSMKVLLPALAAAMVLLVIAWPQLIPDVARTGIDFKKIAREQAKTLNMLNARYSGVDDHNQPFNVAADLATQMPDDENIVELQHPMADITTNQGDVVALAARVGHYHRQEERLELSGKVHLTQDKGFDVVTETASIDLKNGTAAGDSPVSGEGPSGKLQSEGFRLRDRGNVIVFTGKSHLLIYPQAKADAAKHLGVGSNTAPGSTQ